MLLVNEVSRRLDSPDHHTVSVAVDIAEVPHNTQVPHAIRVPVRQPRSLRSARPQPKGRAICEVNVTVAALNQGLLGPSQPVAGLDTASMSCELGSL